jgi:ornithine cyclodeaminase
VLFDGETGQVRAVMNASAITAIRTAAVSGVATRLLAREDASRLAIIGAGVQARKHLEAMAAVLDLESARVYSVRPPHAQTLAAEAAARYAFPVEAVASAEEALRGADVVVTATTSVEPVLRREWLAAGAHVNAVGACFPTARELDTATVAAAAFFVDRRESALNEAGDLLIPIQEGAIGPEHIRGELGEVLVGKIAGRTAPDELTVFESQGIAVEDLASAQFLLRRAAQTGAGVRVEF